MSSLASQFDVSGDDAVDALAVAEEEPAGVVEAETFSGDGGFVGRNDGDGAANEGVVRVIFAEEGREGGFGSADGLNLKVLSAGS